MNESLSTIMDRRYQLWKWQRKHKRHPYLDVIITLLAGVLVLLLLLWAT